jgi:vacuolar-type H+-ATPase subunit E/Vma4|tara:strand:- start:2884 stop:3081 length:198 start_codon:yes stop_codon:yes gene_type:complete
LAKQKVDDAKKVMADTLLEERASAEAVRTEIENEVERELSEAQNAIDEAKAGAWVSISHPTQTPP